MNSDDLQRRVAYLEQELARLRKELRELRAGQAKVEAASYQAGG